MLCSFLNVLLETKCEKLDSEVRKFYLFPATFCQKRLTTIRNVQIQHDVSLVTITFSKDISVDKFLQNKTLKQDINTNNNVNQWWG